MKIYLMNPCIALLDAIKNRKSVHFPNPRGWTKKRIENIRDRDNHTCKFCGAKQTDKTFHVHHIDGDRYNCKQDNTITLCANCHSSIGTLRLK